MDERSANVVAGALGGSAWHSGGGVWLVLKERPDGTPCCDFGRGRM